MAQVVGNIKTYTDSSCIFGIVKLGTGSLDEWVEIMHICNTCCSCPF